MKAFNLYRPQKNSHKGQNGKLLVIGGSELFHSSIFWSADVASRIVDLVHLTSPANENNQIFRKRLKEKFWNGIVVDWKDVEGYIEEDDCVLIGPGMTRGDGKTKKIVNYLLKKYPDKKWVIDGGALQEVKPELITESCILTPHKKEFINLADKSYKNYKDYNCANLSQELNSCAILLKGQTDIVCQGKKCTEIKGGNAGMTKGGTGDVLAGLAAALFTKNDSWTSATMASYINKKAGESLHKRVGPYFNAEDLVKEVPLTIYGIMKESSKH
jgi:NAD(P)H-hydrate epimerase